MHEPRKTTSTGWPTAAETSTTWSTRGGTAICGSSAERSTVTSFAYAAPRSGKSQFGASGVAMTIPAFAPISVVIPARVMRSPCGREPAPWNSTHAYRAPSVPISRTTRMIASFIVTPLRGLPVNVTLIDSGTRSQVRPSASATAISVAPMPAPKAPTAPYEFECESLPTITVPGSQ